MRLDTSDYKKFKALKLSPLHFSVLFQLIDRMNKDTGRCFGKAESLGALCNVKSRKTVGEALRFLQDEGLIECHMSKIGFEVSRIYLERGRKSPIHLGKIYTDSGDDVSKDYASSGQKTPIHLSKNYSQKLKNRNLRRKGLKSVCNTHTHAHEEPSLADCLDVAEEMRKDGLAISDDFVRDTYVPRMSAKGWTNGRGIRITRSNLRNSIEAWFYNEPKCQTLRPMRSDVPQRDRHDQPEGVVLRQEGYDATRFDKPTLDAVDKATILQQLGGVA